MTKFLIRWIINSIAIFVAFLLIPGIRDEPRNWLAIAGLGLIFGLVNALLRPLLTVLTCPLIVLTLGLFTLVINTFLFWLTGRIGAFFGIGFQVGFWQAFLGGLVVSVVSVLLSLLFKDELEGRRT